MRTMNSGILFALGAYLSWGLFPLYFRQIATIPALLAGYLYAHTVGRRPLRQQVVLQAVLILVAAIVLPIERKKTVAAVAAPIWCRGATFCTATV